MEGDDVSKVRFPTFMKAQKTPFYNKFSEQWIGWVGNWVGIINYVGDWKSCEYWVSN